MAIYTDITSSFTQNPITGDLAVSSDVNAIINSCKNLLMIDKYELPFKEYRDPGLTDELFELISPITASSIKSKIKGIIEQYERRANELIVDVKPNQEENGYEITISFTPQNSIQSVSFNLFLERAI